MIKQTPRKIRQWLSDFFLALSLLCRKRPWPPCVGCTILEKEIYLLKIQTKQNADHFHAVKESLRCINENVSNLEHVLPPIDAAYSMLRTKFEKLEVLQRIDAQQICALDEKLRRCNPSVKNKSRKKKS